MRYRRGQWVRTCGQISKDVPRGRTGKIVYIHPSRRWLNVDLARYVESFMIEDVEPARSPRRRKKQDDPCN